MEDVEDITAIFELKTTDLPDIYNLHASKNGVSTKCCVAYINTMSCSKMVKNISSPFWIWMSSKIERALRKVCATFDENMRLETVQTGHGKF